MTNFLLGVDPGLRTGVCIIGYTATEFHLQTFDDIGDGVDGFITFWENQKLSFRDHNTTIVMEDFITREGTYGLNHTPERVIGAVKALAAQRNIPVIMRPPSGRLKQAPDAILRALNVYLAGKGNRNAKEAVRHCVAFLKAQKHPAILAAFDKEV